jgi:hypothetical protein
VTVKHDAINSPAHYNSHKSGIEAIEVTENYGFCLGNSIKYLWRLGLKDASAQELGKARWYVERELAYLDSTQRAAHYKVSYINPDNKGVVLGLIEHYLAHEEDGPLKDVKELLMRAPFYVQSVDALEVASERLQWLVNHAKLNEMKAELPA